MNREYRDLLALTPHKPSFFQEGGVPRWGAFTPGESNGVYASEVAIVEIACQGCDTRFHVLMESKRHEASLAQAIMEKSLHYGDPPNVGCCPAGPTMNSEPVSVVEYWRRNSEIHWTHDRWSRDTSKEIAFRRFGDPWTESMIEKAKAFINDPEKSEDERRQMQSALDAELRRVNEVDNTMSDPPEYASQFRSQ